MDQRFRPHVHGHLRADSKLENDVFRVRISDSVVRATSSATIFQLVYDLIKKLYIRTHINYIEILLDKVITEYDLLKEDLERTFGKQVIVNRYYAY